MLFDAPTPILGVESMLSRLPLNVHLSRRPTKSSNSEPRVCWERGSAIDLFHDFGHLLKQLSRPISNASVKYSVLALPKEVEALSE
jgi:hypothetical protein